MSIAVYVGGRSNGSPSPGAKPDLDEATLMLALLALNTADPCEISVVRMLRDRPNLRAGVGTRAGAGKGNGSCVLAEEFGGSLTGSVEESGPGSGDAGTEWFGMTGNGGIGGRFVDNGVGGMNAAHGYRSILERAVIVATREFFDSVAGKKTGHETQATTTNPNASRKPLVRTYMLSVAPPPDGMTNGLSLGTMPRLLGRRQSRAGMFERHRSISGVASEMSGNWRKGGRLKIIPPVTSRKDPNRRGKNLMG
ncbi:hypothetical protein EDB84DRAFT_1679520 [Lactarius hengduanensis]|nr:hypothetical protein EDB84DRAFT_1679520 [Lactarius hengduanensis]